MEEEPNCCSVQCVCSASTDNGDGTGTCAKKGTAMADQTFQLVEP